jgi:hypothetical protein
MRPRLLNLILAVICLGAALRAEPAPLPVGLSENEQAIVLAYRSWLAEVIQAEAKFQGTLETSEGPFLDLGKVDFILRQTADWPRNYLHDHDHTLVFSAVKGQTDAELEANLPAIIHYIRLAVASRTYHTKARRQLPLVGKRRGLDRVIAIAKQVYDFRGAQVDRVEHGNLGDLGDPKLLAELRAAYIDGQQQFSNQRNGVILAVLAVELGISFLIAVCFLQRRRPVTVVRPRRPLPAEA